MPHQPAWLSRLARFLAVWLWCAGTAVAQGVASDGFEGPEVAWQSWAADARFRVLAHQRSTIQPHGGAVCEFLHVETGDGTYVYFGYPIRPAAVIDELRAALWIRSDQPGLQLLLRVVLPRTLDPATGRPLTIVVGGAVYSEVGRWQRLELQDVPQRVRGEARSLALQRGRPIDERGAVVDAVLLNVHNPTGRARVFIDDLELTGLAAVDSELDNAVSPASASLPRDPATTTDRARVELVGGVLLCEGRPLLPRIVEHRGEPLEFLARLVFNTVALAAAPTLEQQAEAQRLNLWLLTPPPEEWLAEIPRHAAGDYDRVLAWDLGRRLDRRDLPRVKEWARRVRQFDPLKHRPLLAEPRQDLYDFSRHVDLVQVALSPLDTTLELKDFGTWVRARPQLARPGTPLWTAIATQPDEQLQRQRELLAGGRPASEGATTEQLRLAVATVVAAGSRGLLFQSRSRLDAADPQSLRRAMALELLNLELQLAEPWAAAGHFIGTVPSHDPEVVAAAIRTDRAQLLLPMWSGRAAQMVPGQSLSGQAVFVVPGVPEAYNAYALSPSGLKPLRSARVTGGMRIQIDDLGLASLILLTADPTVMQYLTLRVQQTARRAAELQGQMTGIELAETETTLAALDAAGRLAPQSSQMLEAARNDFQEAGRLFVAGQYENAYSLARRATRPLSVLRRVHWQQAAESLGSPAATPFANNFRTLPDHWRLASFLHAAVPSANQLPASGFEGLEALVRAGWQHVAHPQPNIETQADLTPAAARSGQLGLRLLARSTAEPPELLESPPVWIVSPRLPIQPGQVVRIHGWVNIPEPITASVDGLMIVDSLGGPALAERIGKTGGWREFTLYRGAGEGDTLHLAFVLTGLGEAWLDDVTVEYVGNPWDLHRYLPALPDPGEGALPANQAAALPARWPRLRR